MMGPLWFPFVFSVYDHFGRQRNELPIFDLSRNRLNTHLRLVRFTFNSLKPKAKKHYLRS